MSGILVTRVWNTNHHYRQTRLLRKAPSPIIHLPLFPFPFHSTHRLSSSPSSSLIPPLLGSSRMSLRVVSVSKPSKEDQRHRREVHQPSENNQNKSRSVSRSKSVFAESMMGDSPADYHEEKGDGSEQNGKKLVLSALPLGPSSPSAGQTMMARR